jgi:branched-chain amino acid transport system ATP-binding protein
MFAESASSAPSNEAPTADGLLEVEGVTKLFGPLRALDDVSLSVKRGEILGLVGPNGSGKTTVINVISGLLVPTSGRVLLEGQEVSGKAPFRLARRGINRTFQIPKPFPALTARENLEVAHHGSALADGEILELVGLGGRAERLAGELTASDQKRLDLARALVTGPRLLLVDELGAGLSKTELDELAVILRRLVAELGMTMVVVEHLMGFLEQVADRVTVLNAGAVIFSGGLAEALADPAVIKVFIGG